MTEKERNAMTDRLIEMLDRIDEINKILNNKEQLTISELSTPVLSSKEEILHI